MTTTPVLLIDPEELRRWKSQPATEEFFLLLEKRRQDLTQAWARGVSMGPEQQASAVLLSQLLGLSAEDFRNEFGIEERDDEQERI